MDYSETQTRREMIDKALQLAGWNLDDPSQVIEELDIDLAKAGMFKAAEPKDEFEGRQFADYGLMLDGKPLAVVEAKRTSKDAEAGQEQALQYAQNLQKLHGGNLPFIFYANGLKTYYWESDFYPPSVVYGYPCKDDLLLYSSTVSFLTSHLSCARLAISCSAASRIE